MDINVKAKGATKAALPRLAIEAKPVRNRL